MAAGTVLSWRRVIEKDGQRVVEEKSQRGLCFNTPNCDLIGLIEDSTGVQVVSFGDDWQKNWEFEKASGSMVFMPMSLYEAAVAVHEAQKELASQERELASQKFEFDAIMLASTQV